MLTINKFEIIFGSQYFVITLSANDVIKMVKNMRSPFIFIFISSNDDYVANEDNDIYRELNNI